MISLVEGLSTLTSLVPFAVAVGVAVGMGRGLKAHTLVDGNLRRGVPIWRSQVDADVLSGRQALPAGRHELEWGWARVEGHRLLVRAEINHSMLRKSKWKGSTSWPYVMLIDRRSGKISWRIPLGTFLFIVPHICFLFPFTVLLMTFNHKLQASACYRALELLAQAGVEPGDTDLVALPEGLFVLKQ